MHRIRSGFTLVEMMVAMALTIFVMVILSQCFIAGLETFSQLKAIGDMQEQLRTAATLLRADLREDHFEGKRRLSDPWPSFSPLTGGETIREGFFVVGSGYPYKLAPNPPIPALAPSSTKVTEGVEDNIISYRFTDHYLHFTSKMRGNQREKFYAAPASLLLPPNGLGGVVTNYFGQSGDALFLETGANVFHSPWAEIVYLLLPTGTTVNPSVPGGAGTPLYALYRCQYAVLPQTTDANNLQIVVSPTDASPYVSIAGNPKVVPGPKVVMDFYSPGDLATGHLRRTFNPYAFFGPPPVTISNPPRGAALVLSNVVSFQVLALKNPTTTGEFDELGETAPDSKPQLPNRYYIPFDTANYVYKTPIPTPFPLPPSFANPFSPINPSAPTYGIQGLQIILRIWDPKSQLTRQITIVQDM